MSKKMIFLLIFIFILGVMNSAGEIVLQNGYNGYEGCTDTHLRSEGDGENMPFCYIHINYHSDTHLMTANSFN